jgi:hypothetical protein
LRGDVEGAQVPERGIGKVRSGAQRKYGEKGTLVWRRLVSRDIGSKFHDVAVLR